VTAGGITAGGIAAVGMTAGIDWKHRALTGMYGAGNLYKRLEDYLLIVGRQNHIGNRSDQNRR
jgi:hypothetical protein